MKKKLWILGGVALAVGVASAIARAWMSDDAYISFRYAENLKRGLGLVYNAGERVEGMTNFLWTLWTWLGMVLGVSPERWTEIWGIAAYAGTIALLVRRARTAIPIAAILAACHVEWAVFSTSGLETSAVTFLAFAAYVCAVEDRPIFAGILIGLAALTRPDTLLFAPILGAFFVWTNRRGAIAFALGFAVAWGPATLWRIHYYGDFYPNTYYAKSAALAWWSQGLEYARLYFARYWVLLAAFPLAPIAFSRAGSRERQEILLEAALALSLLLGVIRVGGDFMFARMLIPITPFLAILIERAVTRAQAPIALAAAAGLFFTPSPVGGVPNRGDGIVDEHAVYTKTLPDWPARVDRQAAILRHYFDGLPVKVCFFGTQAQLVYKTKVAVAIECETGLTDRAIAHQPIDHRGRIGHEKVPRLTYLLDERALDIALSPAWASVKLKLDQAIPEVPIDLGGVQGRIMTWDPPVLDALRARGAKFPDYAQTIDDYLARMSTLSDEQVKTDYTKMKRFYFDHVSDPARQAAFASRLH